MKQGKYKKADFYLSKSIEIDPQYVKALSNLAITTYYLEKHDVKTWLLNTGLVGGPAGIGKRISIRHTRAILTSVLDGSLNQVEFEVDPWFGFEIPLSCPGVPDQMLNPSASWSDQDAYRNNIELLVAQFKKNMKKYKKSTPQEVLLAGPK